MNLQRYWLRAVLSAGLLFGCEASAQMVFTFDTFGGDPDLAIPDNQATGVNDVRSVSGVSGNIADLNVFLNISGDVDPFNGDLYVSLSHGSGFSVLMNRVGRRSGDSLGYEDPGVDIKLDDAASNGDLHNYRVELFGSHSGDFLNTELTGTWAPDARNVDPDESLSSSDRTAFLSDFNGLDANGDWTLFLSDHSPGGGNELRSWGLEITPVPEPSQTAAISGLLCVAAAAVYRRFNKASRGERSNEAP